MPSMSICLVQNVPGVGWRPHSWNLYGVEQMNGKCLAYVKIYTVYILIIYVKLYFTDYSKKHDETAIKMKNWRVPIMAKAVGITMMITSSQRRVLFNQEIYMTYMCQVYMPGI
jgi:hypothetical protein